MNDTLTPEIPTGRGGSGAPKRLVRTPDGKIAGVAAGIAHYLGVDPTIVRIAFLVLAFAGGIGILLYLACWIVMPKGEADATREPSSVDPWTAVGIVGLIAGVGLLVGWHGIGDLGRVAVAVALVVGGVLLIGRTTGGPAGPDDAGAPAPPVAPPPPDEGTGAEPPAPGAAPPPAEAGTDAVPDAGERVPEAAAAASGTRRRAPVTALVLGALALALAVVLAADLDGRLDVETSTVLAAALVVVGVGLAVASATGGAPWLFPIAILLTVGLVGAAVVEPIADRGIGERDYAPVAVDDVSSEYRLGIGELTVDLTNVPLDGTVQEVDVRLGIGKAEVVVPPGATVELDGHVGAGRLEGPDASEVDGLGRDLVVSLAGEPGRGTIVLDLEVGIGEGVVTRG